MSAPRNAAVDARPANTTARSMRDAEPVVSCIADDTPRKPAAARAAPAPTMPSCDFPARSNAPARDSASRADDRSVGVSWSSASRRIVTCWSTKSPHPLPMFSSRLD